MAIALSGQPDTFITLTVNPALYGGPHERARRLSDAWRRIKRAACKRYGYKQIPYLAVFEKTKRGEPHLHILARCRWIDQRWLSDQMRRLIGAPICDIRRVVSARHIAYYVAKYIQKDPTKFEGVKRYFRTLDYDTGSRPGAGEDGEHDASWQVVKRSVFTYVRELIDLGFDVTQDGDTWTARYNPSRWAQAP